MPNKYIERAQLDSLSFQVGQEIIKEFTQKEAELLKEIPDYLERATYKTKNEKSLTENSMKQVREVLSSYGIETDAGQIKDVVLYGRILNFMDASMMTDAVKSIIEYNNIDIEQQNFYKKVDLSINQFRNEIINELNSYQNDLKSINNSYKSLNLSQKTDLAKNLKQKEIVSNYEEHYKNISKIAKQYNFPMETPEIKDLLKTSHKFREKSIVRNVHLTKKIEDVVYNLVKTLNVDAQSNKDDKPKNNKNFIFTA